MYMYVTLYRCVYWSAPHLLVIPPDVVSLETRLGPFPDMTYAASQQQAQGAIMQIWA